MIRTKGLTKRFGAVHAVEDLALDVAEGDVYGFLGPNGSGKTTTVRMLLGLVLATSGSIEVMGQPMPARARDVLPEVGALVEGPAAYAGMSGRANLVLFDSMGPAGLRVSRARRVDDALDEVGLGGVDNRPVRAYSLGMRQRLGLAAALLRAPRLLVLDEPTNGLDPQGIREIRDLLLRLNQNGHHDLPVLAPACGGRADVRPCRRDRPRAPGAPGAARGAAPTDRPAAGPYARRGPRAVAARRTGGVVRRSGSC